MSILKPLPERLRPAKLDQFVGQAHLRGRLSNLLKAQRLPSLLFFGPPGCGKSTLALLLAQAHSERVLRISAPEAGLQSLRRSLSNVEILVLDELHRFSKAQQDFFLPAVESGEITLLATTTENPSFSVTRQLLSRLHVLRLRPLSVEELKSLLDRGLREMEIGLEQEAREMLAVLAHGDARTLFNLLEYIVGLSDDERRPAALKALLPEILIRHDRDGDSHYELASALIKSIRGSDPDAALYYLACLLEGGEDPRFICRRLILSASEDVGLADPYALTMAVSCQQAVEFVGMPEGFIPLAETVVYLALARKSNSTYAAYHKAARDVRDKGPRPVPLHLRNAVTAMHKTWGYGKGYKYPHNFPDGWVRQQYLPDEVEGAQYYHPAAHGDEARLAAWWKRLQAEKAQSGRMSFRGGGPSSSQPGVYGDGAEEGRRMLKSPAEKGSAQHAGAEPLRTGEQGGQPDEN
ncbi:MAG: replication-associated recombination protein A [Desulfovibrionaceae bacterium]|nr:replication-associated recombination protein A [Desulfovibrionaceae bacterium]